MTAAGARMTFHLMPEPRGHTTPKGAPQMAAALAFYTLFALTPVLLIAVMVYYGVMPTWNLLFLPFLVVIMMSVPAGIGLTQRVSRGQLRQRRL